MVKVRGPMMSLDASGSLADAVTFSKWKGRNYVRERVVPSNPQSGGQTGRRAMFRFLTQAWADLGSADKATWQTIADELVTSPFSAYLSHNLERWHNFQSPTEGYPAGQANNGSDNALTAAAWEENRIKLTIAGTLQNEQWGLAIFASTGSGFTPATGNTIIVQNDDSVVSADYFWTPPTVTTWYFNTRTFSDDGVLETAGGEDSAVP